MAEIKWVQRKQKLSSFSLDTRTSGSFRVMMHPAFVGLVFVGEIRCISHGLCHEEAYSPVWWWWWEVLRQVICPYSTKVKDREP